MGQNPALTVPEMVDNLSPENAKTALQSVIDTGALGIEEQYQSKWASVKRGWSFVSSVTLRDLFLPVDIVDYVDMDIQGAELRVISKDMEILEKKVKRIHVGTHSMEIHDRLLDQFSSGKWELVVQIPPDGDYDSQWGSFTAHDGILSLVNKNLTY